MSSFVDTISELTVAEILEIIASSDPPPTLHITSRLKKNKQALIDTLLGDSPRWGNMLSQAVEQKRATRSSVKRTKAAQRQQKRRSVSRTYTSRVEDTDEQILSDNETVEHRPALASESGFFDMPPESTFLDHYRAFYQATSSDALRIIVCAVCARSLNALDAQVKPYLLSSLPNRDRLAPYIQHPAQTIIDGCLLEPAGCKQVGSDWEVTVCKECHTSLQKPGSKPPKYSLANGLWIGEIPWFFKHLTIAEHLLIARVYPRVFVVKLFPKKGGAGIPLNQLQSGMRGNVTSFELNSDMIADMISGSLMPQPPEILASVLSVTFVGRNIIPDPRKLEIFRVRRQLIVEALEWLRINNARYYGDIVVDSQRLQRLPEDGVPEEILYNIRHEPDELVLNSELDTYVPSEEDMTNGIQDEEGTQSNTLNVPKEDGPDVVPLQFTGVMDTDLSKVSTRELMAWGLSNLWEQNQEGAYAVRHGQPVSTFGRLPAGQETQTPQNHNYWEKALPGLYPYGVGGIEANQPVPLSFIEHVRWSLQYHDRRFRVHPTFIFIACSIQQRREALASARIQMRRRDWEAVARIINTITPQDLEQAAEEESG